MAKGRMIAGIITALCLSGLRGRDGGLGTSALRRNGRSPNYRNAAFERWTKSEHEVSRRYDGSEYYSPYSTSAFSSNFSGRHHGRVHEPPTPLHHYESRSHHSQRRHPQEYSRRRPQHRQTSVAARQNRGIEDQGERETERASERAGFLN